MSAPPFRLAHPAWFVVLDGGMATLIALTASDRLHRAVRARVPVPSRRALAAILAGSAAVHAAEAVVAHRRATRGGLDDVAGRWAGQALVVGSPALFALSRTLEERDAAPRRAATSDA